KRIKEWTCGGAERPDLLHDGLQVLDSSAQFGIGTFPFAVNNERFDGLGDSMETVDLPLSDLDDARDEFLVCLHGIVFGGVEEQNRYSAEPSALQFAARVLPLDSPTLLDRFDIHEGRLVTDLERLLLLVQYQQHGPLLELTERAGLSKLSKEGVVV